MIQEFFLQNKYTKWYYSIINKAIIRGHIEPNEQHHVIPESFYLNRKRKGSSGWLEGNPNNPSNLVLLTPREHLLCHKLLVKMTTGEFKVKMYNALHLTSIHSNNQKRKSNLTSKQYEQIKLELRNRLLGKTYEELHGEEKAKEIKKKQSLPGEKNGFFGKNHTEEQRKKKSAEKLLAPKITCYHCKKEVDHMNYSRWHGDKCKHNKENL